MKKYAKKNSRIVLVALAVLLFGLAVFLPVPFLNLARADGKIIFTAPESVMLGDQFVLKVSVDSGGDSVNAISGTISVGDGLSILGVTNDGGLVPLWIEAPSVSSDGGEISFAGIIPGGFEGLYELFTLMLSAGAGDNGEISLHEVEARANDLSATAVPIDSSPVTIRITAGNGTKVVSTNDTLPPEPFEVSIERDPLVFDGAPFAVFVAQDKQTGIDRYEEASGYWGVPPDGAWRDVKSPYELSEEDTGKKLYVRAVDRAGNMRTEYAVTPSYYARLASFGIISALILCVLYIVKRRLSRSRY